MGNWNLKQNSHSEWWTPPELFQALDDEFFFDLDAAATAENSLCSRYITPEEDALITPWDGACVWCNPPYGRGHDGTASLLTSFIKRGYEQSQEQQNEVIMLLPAYTDPKYWSEYVMRAHEVRFLKGRLQFLENGKKKMSARFPSVVVHFKWIKGNTYGKAPNQFVWAWKE